jgi:hypothetical protein
VGGEGEGLLLFRSVLSKSEANGPLGQIGFVEGLRVSGLTVCV